MTTDCQHDYKHPVRKGRAHYVCPKCGQDITLELVMIIEADGATNDWGDRHGK